MNILSRSGIYAIGGPNGGIYVGSAERFGKRWVLHKSLLRRGKHHSPHLQHAWDKYGSECLHFEILEIVDDVTQLYAIEQHYLDALFATVNRRRIYNVTRSADGATARDVTDETRQRLSIALRGKKRTAETRKRMSEGRQGMKFAAGHVQNIALGKSGGKRYIVTNPTGVEYQDVINVTAFAREHGLLRSGLTQVLAGKARSHHGWVIRLAPQKG